MTGDARFEALLDATGEGVLLQDATGAVLASNPAAQRMFGVTREAMAGAADEVVLLAADSSPLPREEWPSARAARTGEPVRELVGALAPDGSLWWLLVHSRRLPDGSVLTTLADETVRREAERALRETEARLAALVERSPVLVCILDAEGRMTYASLGIQRQLGWLPGEVAGRRGIDSVHPDDRPELVAALAATTPERPGIEDVVVRVRNRDGGWRWLSLNAIVRFDVETPAGVEIIARDVTELRRARDEAVAAAHDKEDFLATMSHEIRTPLAGITGAAELLLADGLTAQQRDLARVIADAAGALSGLLGDVLDVTRIEDGRLVPAAVEFSPRDVITGIAGVLRPTLRDRPVVLAVDVGADVPEVLRGDRDRIRQIVLNLASNAAKYTERGRVRIAAEHAGGRLRVAVHDTGAGIAPEELDRLFAPWVRGHGHEVAGAGLGLSIARRLARAIGGDVTAASTPGTGSTFTLEVPCAVGEAPATTSGGDEPGLSGRVLLAEDDAALRRILTLQLERLGLTVTAVPDGGAALDASARGAWDAVLLDLRMPVLDGIAVARSIRAHEPPGERVPIVALTADSRAEDVAACHAAGMDGHLAKPVGAGALRAALAGHLHRGATSAPAQPPVVDAALLGELARSLGSTAPLIEVLAAYRAELPVRLERLRAALASGSVSEVRRVAHELRSPSASFGLPRLAAAVRAVEDGAGPPALAAVEAAAAEADAALRAWCAAPAAG